jgi:hypothetical protein
MARGPVANDANTDDLVSLDWIAAEIGVSRQRVQQLLAKGILKARAACDARGLTWEDFADAMARDGHRCRVEPPALGHPLAGHEPAAATRARHGRA